MKHQMRQVSKMRNEARISDGRVMTTAVRKSYIPSYHPTITQRYLGNNAVQRQKHQKVIQQQGGGNDEKEDTVKALAEVLPPDELARVIEELDEE